MQLESLRKHRIHKDRHTIFFFFLRTSKNKLNTKGQEWHFSYKHKETRTNLRVNLGDKKAGPTYQSLTTILITLHIEGKRKPM